MQLDFFTEEKPEQEKDKRTMLCRKCGVVHPVSHFGKRAVEYEFGYCPVGSASVTGSARYCKSCAKEYAKAKYLAHKMAPPKPSTCQCCGDAKQPKELHMDHCHETGDFRGWVCRNCNQGLGQLGDNVEGLTKAIKYLMKVQNERD